MGLVGQGASYLWEPVCVSERHSKRAWLGVTKQPGFWSLPCGPGPDPAPAFERLHSDLVLLYPEGSWTQETRLGWAWRDRGIPAAQQRPQGAHVCPRDKDQDSFKQVQVRGVDNSGEGSRGGHNGRTIITVLTPRATAAVTSGPPQIRASSHLTLDLPFEGDPIFILSLKTGKQRPHNMKSVAQVTMS